MNDPHAHSNTQSEGASRQGEGGAGWVDPVARTVADPTLREGGHPEFIGDFRVLQLISDKGGMGLIYLGARDHDGFQQIAAVKVLKRWDCPGVVRRFKRERRVLSGLDHRNIAKLYDAGNMSDGRPYFAMQYIEGGLPITDYCRQHQLEITARVRLFRDLCRAVQYAHANLIVHRDLKPSNVLVSKDGEVLLLDFGIAKMLNEKLAASEGDETIAGGMPMTPEYASPEQVRREPITIQSDVYSLGVLLYELLTGAPPYTFDRNDEAQIRRCVCDVDPPFPEKAVDAMPRTKSGGDPTTEQDFGTSTRQLKRKLAGDLGNIVMMAMQKKPGHRYSSVDLLLADLAREERGETVIAKPQTAIYRTSRFLQRNRVPVAISGMATFGLVAGLFALWQTSEARAKDAEAQVQLARANAAVADSVASATLAQTAITHLRGFIDFQLTEVDRGIARLPDTVGVRRELAQRAAEHLEALRASLPGQVAAQPALLQEIARAYERLGDVLGGGGFSNDDRLGARQMFEQALALRERARSADGSASEAVERRDESALLIRLSENAVDLRDRPDEALAWSSRAVEMRRLLLSEHPDEAAAMVDLSVALNALGRAANMNRRPAEEERAYYESFDLMRRVIGQGGSVAGAPEVLRNLSVAAMRLGSFREREGALEEAERYYTDALEVRRRLLRAADQDALVPVDVTLRRDVAIAAFAIGRTVAALGQADEAQGFLEEAFAFAASQPAMHPTVRRSWSDLAVITPEYGRILLAQGDISALLHMTARLIAAVDPVSDLHIEYVRRMGWAHEFAAALHATLGDASRTVEHLAAATDAAQRARIHDASDDADVLDLISRRLSQELISAVWSGHLAVDRAERRLDALRSVLVEISNDAVRGQLAWYIDAVSAHVTALNGSDEAAQRVLAAHADSADAVPAPWLLAAMRATQLHRLGESDRAFEQLQVHRHAPAGALPADHRMLMVDQLIDRQIECMSQCASGEG